MKRAFSVTIFLTSLLFLLSTAPFFVQAQVMNTEPLFSDNFNGPTIDSAKWTIKENGGSITLADSYVALTSGGSSFPCVTSTLNPFPSEGDFALEFDFTYTRLLNSGTGFWASNGPFEPSNENNVAANVMQLWGGIDGMTGFVLIYMLGKQVYRWDAQVNPFGYMHSDPMLIRLEYAKETYTLYMNGTAIASEKSQLRPDTIGFGHPPIFSVSQYGSGSWCSFKIDSVKVIPPAEISLLTSLSSTEVGFKVELNGRVLESQGTPVSGALVVLSSQAYGLSTWNILTTTVTDAEGGYTATWVPAATGNFLLKAQWIGDANNAGTFECKNVSVTRGTGETIFLAESNSTLSSLSFNSDSKEISFMASGPSGTTGYVRFIVSKTLLENLTDFKVYLDGRQVQFTATSEGNIQILYFQYNHSTHNILIKMLDSENQIPELPTATSPFLLIGSIIIISVAVCIVFRKKLVIRHKYISK